MAKKGRVAQIEADDKRQDNQRRLDASKWKRELDLSSRREKDWRSDGDKIIKRYRGEERKKSRFNVLWSNTEILRASIYNSRPNPDVRRRFRDNDPTGKAVSEILERCLMVLVDGYDFDCMMKNDALDGLLPGRGVSRVRYIASIAQTGGDAQEVAAAREESDNNDSEPDTVRHDVEGTANGATAPEAQPEESLQYERVAIEHVDWRDYREGYARVWDEVPWTAYRAKLSKPESEEKFGAEAIGNIKFTVQTAEVESKLGETVGEAQKLAEFWEVWDKEGKRVFFLNDSCDHLLFPLTNPKGQPPLDLEGFFPSPDPLRTIENTGSRDAIPPFQLYREQADDLDRLSLRITKITDAIRLRGVYDSQLSELADLMDSGDNQLTPVQNAAAWRDAGLEKAITWMPVEPAANVLRELYQARQAAKVIIDEITGISDIVRGSTMASETATAQQLKANYASVRLRKLQQEVQRYCRDLLRLAAEVMANKFGQDTFSTMAQVKLPTEIEKQQMQMQAQRSGQPVDPQLMQVPSWEQVMAVMRNDAIRSFKVDVETDSMVAGTLESDMQGLSQVLKAVTETLNGTAPLIMAKALPPEAAKELVMTVVRRSRMGLAVEDAFDKLKAPEPQPEQHPPDSSPQVAQIKAQSDAQIKQLQEQGETQRAQMTEQAETQRQAMTQAHEQQMEQMRQTAESARADAKNATALIIAQQANAHQAQIEGQRLATQTDLAERNGAREDQRASADREVKLAGTAAKSPTAAENVPQEDAAMNEIRDLLKKLAGPRRVVRDANQRVVGVE